MSKDARMWRVVCNRCKGRGHFGRNCPHQAQLFPSKQSFESNDVEAEAAATARALRDGDVHWIIFHEDELQRSQQRGKKAREEVEDFNEGASQQVRP